MLVQNRVLVTIAMVHLHEYLLHVSIIANISAGIQEYKRTLYRKTEMNVFKALGKAKVKLRVMEKHQPSTKRLVTGLI